MISLRDIDATERDARRLAELQALTFREAYEGVHEPEDLRAYCEAHYTASAAIRELRSPASLGRFGFVTGATHSDPASRSGGAPAGYALVRTHAPPVDVGFACSELKQIYVRRAAYGSGLGRALFDDVLAGLRVRGAGGVWLCVSDVNERAKGFYAKLGFERFGAGPELVVGRDRLCSSILALPFALPGHGV